MASAPSPGDPVFYFHHCWIELLWAKWQLAHPGAPFVSSMAGAGLNDPLMEWPDRTPANACSIITLLAIATIRSPPFGTDHYNAIWLKTDEDRPWVAGWVRADLDTRAAELLTQGYRMYWLDAFVLP